MSSSLGRGGGGGGWYSTKFCTGMLRRGPNLPFYIPFLTEKVILSYTFRRKWYPFNVYVEFAKHCIKKWPKPCNRML